MLLHVQSAAPAEATSDPSHPSSLHQIRPTHRRCLSESERATLTAIAEAAIPAGKLMPGADADLVDRVENFLSQLDTSVAKGYRALLHGLDAIAYAKHWKPVAKLDLGARERLLDGVRRGDYLRRTALRALLTPLKIAHYDDPTFYAKVGCVYTTEGARPEKPRWPTDHVVRLASLTADEELECDVVVVGTGAGGAVVARELAERGHAVVLVEEGEHFTRADFTGRAVDMQRKMYRDFGATVSIGNVGIPIPIGKTVGGSTTINSGTCYRVPARVLAKWRDKFGLAEFTPELMARYYERVEGVLEVAPATWPTLGGTAKVIARGCEALGYHKHNPLLRNAPACDGKGVCCFGCPTDAKRSTNVSYIPLALRAGAQLYTGARVEKILTSGGRAAGIEARAVSGARAKLTVRAKITVIACGTLLTPALLEKNGLAGGSGELGKNLSIHPAAAMGAWFDEQIAGFSAVPQGYAIEQFHDEGILFEGGTPPLEITAATIPLVGRRFVELLEAADHLAVFGFMIEDTSRGRVRATKGGRPLITYVLNDHDVARLKRGVEILARVFFAAGAKTVMPGVHGFDELRNEADLTRFRRARLHARDFDLSAYHPLGTARMGLDRRSSVVGPDHQAHDVPDLYVTDGSAVPSSLAVNPQMTIMAMATRAAEHIDRRLS